MFERIKEMFESYSQSSQVHKDPTLRSIAVNKSPTYLANDIINILKSLKYKKITYNDVFNEIFTSKAGYEVTINLLSGSNGQTIINAAVYSKENKGKTRKALRFLLNKFKEELNTYIVHE